MIFYSPKYHFSPLSKMSGFSLLELIAVIIIVGILSTTAVVRMSSSDIKLQAAKNDVLAALTLAREISMARSDAVNHIQVIISGSAIDVRNNNVSLSSSLQSYPLSFSDNIQITSGMGTMNFNALGETDATVLILMQAHRTETITVSGVGYAY